MDSPLIPDDLLANIFLRLSTRADLIRASAACVSFRRVVADRSFLRRYRRLHAPPLLGFLGQHRAFCFYLARPPYPSASAASAVALAGDFSFTFLPATARKWKWVIWDVRDGRVLLDRLARQYDDEGRKVLFTEMVVCDPLHRRYLLLPQIPNDLRASVPKKSQRCYETFLLPPGDDEETSFRVMWMGQHKTNLFSFVFSFSNGQWRAGPSLCSKRFGSGRHYAYDCFYWLKDWWGNLLVLDTRRMEILTADSPPEAKGLSDRDVAIVEAGESRLGMFVLAGGACEPLQYAIRQNNGASSSQWQMEKTISMGCCTCAFKGSMGSYLLLYKYGFGSSQPDTGCYSLNPNTFQLERVCLADPGTYTHTYSNFPPSILWAPTVSSAGKETPEQGHAASSSAQSSE